MISKNTYEGTSHTENLSEALASAIAAAAADAQGADFMTKWELKSIKGTQGGFIGNRIITVTIEASSE
jgi:hypothetical protein